MERERQEDEDRDSAEERETGDEERSEDAGGEERSEEDRDEDDSPGPAEPTEEEKKEQRAEDARKAQERLDEVMDAPPEQHAALKADAAGATIVIIGALFIIIGVYVALAVSPWGWAGVAIGVGDIVIGQMIRRGVFSRGASS